MFPAIPIIDGVIKIGSQLIDRFIPDPTKKMEAELEWARLVASSELAQIEVNKTEAAHESVFVSGWRPAIGWICGASFAWSFVVQPFLVFGLAVAGVTIPPLPVLDNAELMAILLGMLGLGGMRSWDKRNGVGNGS